MNSVSQHTSAVRPEISSPAGRAVALDALSFLALAAAVALGTAVVLAAMVLLLAGRAYAAPAAAAPLQPPAVAEAAAVCAAGEITNFVVPVADPRSSRPPLPVEHCHFTMKFSHVPERRPAPTLLRVRREGVFGEGSA